MALHLKNPSDDWFDHIAAVAARGERCPFNEQMPAGLLPRLARAGKIRIEVFRHNWRVVTILQGEHAGKTTAHDTSMSAGSKPYVVIDAGSAKTRSEIGRDHVIRAPWKPGTPKP